MVAYQPCSLNFNPIKRRLKYAVCSAHWCLHGPASCRENTSSLVKALLGRNNQHCPARPKECPPFVWRLSWAMLLLHVQALGR